MKSSLLTVRSERLGRALRLIQRLPKDYHPGAISDMSREDLMVKVAAAGLDRDGENFLRDVEASLPYRGRGPD